MGKGGKADTKQQKAVQQQQPSSSSSPSADKEWKSTYNPLDPKAPKLPTKGEIKAAIPSHCFERSYIWGMSYLIRDFIIAAGFAYATHKILSTDFPVSGLDEFKLDPVSSVSSVLLWTAGWTFYAFWMGTIMTGPWVVAHECGHGAFSPSQTWNDIVGFIVHQSLLVPYFAWQYTHAKHHRRTNHLTDGESHVPSTKAENGLGPNNERLSFYAAWHEAMGDGAFAGFQVWTHLVVGWPLYLLGLASTGKVDVNGEPLNGRIADHFRSSSPMFPDKIAFKINLSTATTVASIAGLLYLQYQVGALPVILWYWNPYMVVNAWLVLYTWLQHSDPSVPHYGDGEWTWVRGALSTIDRPYGIFDFFHHKIGSTHVAHHLFHEMPHYNAKEATEAIKAYLEPKGLYNYDPTPWYQAMWKVAHTCHYVETDSGIQYYKSLEDVPRTKDLKKD